MVKLARFLSGINLLNAASAARRIGSEVAYVWPEPVPACAEGVSVGPFAAPLVGESALSFAVGVPSVPLAVAVACDPGAVVGSAGAEPGSVPPAASRPTEEAYKQKRRE